MINGKLHLVMSFKVDYNKNEKGVVYCAINTKNFKMYIGYTSSKLSNRIRSHFHNSKYNTSNNHFSSALCKYGKLGFHWIVLFKSSHLGDLKSKEKEFIKILETNNRKYGYNLTTGGEQCHFDELVKKKISDKAKARGIIGEKNPFYGKNHTEETKKRLSNIRKGKCWNLGYKHSAETKLKLSQIRKEVCKKPEVIENIRRAQKSIRIKCIETNEIYYSIAEAARKLNISYGNLKAHIRGVSKKCKGLHFVKVQIHEERNCKQS